MIGIEPQKEWSEKLQYKLGKALRWKKFSIRLLRKIEGFTGQPPKLLNRPKSLPSKNHNSIPT
jgi:hypothetical protein